MPQLSATGMRVAAEMLRGGRGGVLYEACRAGGLTPDDLCELTAQAWLWSDSPEIELSTERWLEIFKATGFFTWPTPQPSPVRPVTLYRASTTERRIAMSWTGDSESAEVFGHRHRHHGNASLYRAVVDPGTVLAYLYRPDDGCWTVVVDPAGLAEPTVVKPL